MSTLTKDSKIYTNIPPPPTPPVMHSGKAKFDLRHIPTTIELDTSNIENVIFTQKIKRFEFIDSIMEVQLKIMSDIIYGGQLAILSIQRWCKWYRSLNKVNYQIS